MADTKTTALSALAALSDDDLFYVVDDPGGTPASKKATAATVKSFMGGLAIQTAKTASFTAANGELYPVDLSGASSDIECTFPTNTAGHRFGLFVSVPHAANTYGCEPLSTTSIRGSTSHDNKWSLFMKGEYLFFTGDGTTWHAEDGRIPFECKLRRDNAQSIAAGGLAKVAFDAEEFDNGNIGDIATNDRVTIKRANKYLATYSGGMDSVSDGQAFIIAQYLNNARDRNVVFSTTAVSDTDFFVGMLTDIQARAVGDYLEMFMLHSNTGGTSINTNVNDFSRPEMTVIELLD